MRKSSKEESRRAYMITFIIVAVVFLIVSFVSAAENKLESIVYDTIKQKSGRIIYSEINDYIKQNGEIGEIISINYDEKGNIIGITTDSIKVNTLNSKLGQRISDALEKLKNDTASFPVGELTGIDILSGSGFDVDIRFHSISDVDTEIVSEFDDCGINQTKHTIKLKIKADINAVLPGKDIKTTTEQEFLISETVIVGKIPAVYMNNTEHK